MTTKFFDERFTREGGRYYRAYAFFWGSVIIMLPIVSVATLLAYINPLWFLRDEFMNAIGHLIQWFCSWRNYRMQAIYMNCDPKMWEALTTPGPASGRGAEDD